MQCLKNGEIEIIKEKAVMVKNSQRISNGYLTLTNMRLLYEATQGPEMEYPDSGIFLWHIDDVHASRPRLGLRSGRMLGVTYATGDKGNLVEFIVDDPEKWSRAIGEWTTNAHSRNAVTDRDVEDAVRRRKEEENRTDITLSPEFFQSISQLGRTSSGGSAGSTDKKCGRCGNPVNPGSNFCPSCGGRLL